MADQETSSLPKRRAASRDINYSEKDADAELARRIEHVEKASPRRRNKTQNEIIKSKTIKNDGGKPADTSDKFRYQNFLSDKLTPWNLVPFLPPSFRKTSRFSNFIELEGSFVSRSRQCLYSTEGELRANDTIYMISEPPGEPYYIGRIVEFVCRPEFRQLVEELETYVNQLPAKYFQVKMNWYYRPRDIHDHSNNVSPRLLYASLHQDVCPITSYRGRCIVLHKDETKPTLNNDMELTTRDNVFYFDQLFDRHSLKYFDVFTTDRLLKIDSKSSFLYYLSKRFRYVFVEEKYPFEKALRRYILKGDDCQENPRDNSWDSFCRVCREWGPNSQCLRCDECKCAVHLFCLNPPITRKPNKGVVWLCYTCLKRQEGTAEALQQVEQEEKDNESYLKLVKSKLDSLATSQVQTGMPIVSESTWFQYMGQYMICHMQDLISDSLLLPYPFKTSRLGTKYQWSGCNDQDEWHPRHYQSNDSDNERGTFLTSKLNWRTDPKKLTAEKLSDYMEKCKLEIPAKLGIISESCNYLDMVLKILMDSDYDELSALTRCNKELTREKLKEPTFSADEIEQFENAVSKYGSELNLVGECVPTQPLSMIVRYYYHWKKTPNGRRIWGGFKGRSKNKGDKEHEKDLNGSMNQRKSNRERKPTKLALESEVCNFQREFKFIDDSCFDVEEMPILKDYFKCMFCDIDYSPMWYKVTGGYDEDDSEAKPPNLVDGQSDKLPGRRKNNGSKKIEMRLNALCIRCARIWRRYGVKWQAPLDVIKRLNGNNNAYLQSLLSAILDEENMNILKTPPELARDKFLEWELIQDAELIARQRLELIKNPQNLTKRKRNVTATRTRLYKMVRKPYDKETLRVENMTAELYSFLKKIKAERNSISQPATTQNPNESTRGSSNELPNKNVVIQPNGLANTQQLNIENGTKHNGTEEILNPHVNGNARTKPALVSKSEQEQPNNVPAMHRALHGDASYSGEDSSKKRSFERMQETFSNEIGQQ